MAARSTRTRWTADEYRQRPTEYDPQLADLIVRRVRNGDVLTDICCDRDMPLPGDFLLWVDQDPSLAERYEQAQRIQAEVHVDEAVSEAFGHDSFRSSIRSRALMQHAEKTHPKKYSPRSVVNTPEKPSDDAAGVDYAAEVRRKLQQMRDKFAAAAAAGQDSGPAGERGPDSGEVQAGPGPAA